MKCSPNRTALGSVRLRMGCAVGDCEVLILAEDVVSGAVEVGKL